MKRLFLLWTKLLPVTKCNIILHFSQYREILYIIFLRQPTFKCKKNFLVQNPTLSVGEEY